MQIPSIPTDSLYKFMAVSGTGLAVLTIGTSVIGEYSSTLAEIQTRHDVERVGVLVSALERQTKTLTTRAALNAQLPRVFDSAADKALWLADADAIARENRDVESRLQQLQLESIEIERKRAVATAPYSAIKSKRGYLTFMAAYGLMQMIVGFSLWYMRIQRWQDKKTKAEATPRSTHMPVKHKFETLRRGRT